MDSDPILAALLLAGGGLTAGALNAVAGGGSFITLPLLVLAGLPTVSANATGTLALLPGYLASAQAFRKDLGRAEGLSVAWVTIICLAGGGAGGALLLVTPTRLFDQVIPWLLLLATAALGLGPRVRALANERRTDDGQSSRLRASCLLLGTAIYGGYFNGGLGIILLAALSLLGVRDLNASNGLKNIASAAITSIAVVVYALGGLVSWHHALAMTFGTIIGGYLGAHFGRRIDQGPLRWAIVVIGALMAAMFFAR